MSDSDPYELAYQIDRLMRRMNAGVEARAPLFDTDRIGPIGGMILLTIAEAQPVALQTVCDMMARDKGQLSRAISSLERRELVARTANAHDSRSTLLSLTEKGSHRVETIKQALDEALGEILTPLGAAEREDLLALLKRL